MPDMWVDVDTAVTVPVNILPLIDDTDFKTREIAIVYNQAGMDLVWNFQTSAGVTTQTAVTPTTAGDYDWTHSGDGMYKIEIPASAGASINNDTEGYGWFTGICTGVLPWRGPVIGFRASGINDLLCDSAYSATRGLAGTALPNAAAGAANGLLISGANTGPMSISGGVSFTNSGGSGLTLSSSGSDGNGLVCTGNGTGAGLRVVGGATGNGVTAVGGSSSGDGINASGTAGNGRGANFAGQGTSAGIRSVGGVTGNGVSIVGGATSGDALNCTASNGNGRGIMAQGNGTAAGLRVVGGATGPGMNMIGGSSSGAGINISATAGNSSGITVTATGTGNGVTITGGSGATGNGVNIAANSTNGHGLNSVGTGTGSGLRVAGGATGAGMSAIGGGTSGDGIECSVTSGAEIDADITGNVTGNLSGSVGSVTGAVGSVTGAVGSIAAGGITTSSFLTGAITSPVFGTGAIDATVLATTAVDEIRDAILADSIAFNGADIAAILNDTGTTLETHLTDIKGATFDGTTDSLEAIRNSVVAVSGTADSGSTTTMVDAALTEADNDYWKGCWIRFTSGTISGQTRLITAFTAASDTITFAPATTQAVGTNTYEILPAGAVNIEQWNGTDVPTENTAGYPIVTVKDGTGTGEIDTASGTVSLSAATQSSIVDNVWDRARSSHTSPGSFGEGVASVQGNVTGSIGSLGATAKTDVNTEVDTALTDIHLDHLLAADYDPAAKPGTATALLNELVESDGGVSRFTANATEAAFDEAIAELGVAAPSATPSLRNAVMLMYMALRNKLVVQTSGTDAIEIYNDAGTKIAAKLITDDGSDYTEAEMA